LFVLVFINVLFVSVLVTGTVLIQPFVSLRWFRLYTEVIERLVSAFTCKSPSGVPTSSAALC